MASHTMKLHTDPFEKISNNSKTLELRLFDEKRQLINLGDEIIFLKEPEKRVKIVTKVTGLTHYSNFSDLMDDFSPELYLGHANKEEALVGVSRFYTEQDQTKNGVLGIRFKVIKK